MLQFKETGHADWLNVFASDDHCIAQFIKQEGVWGVQGLDFRIENADYLRQIADMLDELNKGK